MNNGNIKVQQAERVATLILQNSIAAVGSVEGKVRFYNALLAAFKAEGLDQYATPYLGLLRESFLERVAVRASTSLVDRP